MMQNLSETEYKIFLTLFEISTEDDISNLGSMCAKEANENPDFLDDILDIESFCRYCYHSRESGRIYEMSDLLIKYGFIKTREEKSTWEHRVFEILPWLK